MKGGILLNKSKKRLIAIVLVLLVLAMILLGYSYSKYKDSFTATASTSVAKWSFSGGLREGKSTTTSTTISLADTITSTTIADKKIAPGTSGDFTIVIDATGSNVDIDYDVSVETQTQKPANLYFIYKDTKYSTLNELINDLKKSDNDDTKEFSGTIIHKSDSSESNEEKYSIHWEWPYELKDTYGYNQAQGTQEEKIQAEKDYDAQDLQDGQNISNYSFTLDIVGTQAKEK
jgi:hypothetical protein